MTTRSQFQVILKYHFHTTSQLLNCAFQLGQEQFDHDPGYSRGSLHQIFFHIMRADHNFRRELESGKRIPPLIRLEEFPDLDSLRAGFSKEQALWEALLDGLSDEQLEGTIRLTNLDGEEKDLPYYRILQHVILHGMQHHSEIAALLTQFGHSPGNIDFIFFN